MTNRISTPRQPLQSLSFVIFRNLLLMLAGVYLSGGQSEAQDGKRTGDAINYATDGKVYGALVYATNEKPKDGDKPADPKLLKRLRTAFKDYANFLIIGQKTSPLYKELDSWVDPSADMLIKLDSNGPAKGGGVKVGLKLWLKKKVVLKTNTILKTDSPLFIAGPKWGKGRLVMVVALK